MVELRVRKREHVIDYWYKTQDEEIKALFPSSISSLDEALSLFESSQSENPSSYGQVIYKEDNYIGDVWVFGIDETDEKMAMLSIVIFDKVSWGKGIGGRVISEFIKTCFEKFSIEKVGAFVFADNFRSIKTLEKTGFLKIETFMEDDIESHYYEVLRGEGVAYE